MNRQGVVTLSILGACVVLIIIATLYLRYENNSSISKETEQLFSGRENGVTYIDINGNPISLTEFLGKIAVVTIWASWSPFSEADLGVLGETTGQYSEEDVIAIAVNRKEYKEQAQRFINTIEVRDGVRLVIDQDDLFYTTVGGYAMPETVIFNERGEIVEHIRGVLVAAELKAKIDLLLSED